LPATLDPRLCGDDEKGGSGGRSFLGEIEGGGVAVEDVLGDEPGIGHGLRHCHAPGLPMLVHRARREFEVARAALPGIGAVDQVDEADRIFGDPGADRLHLGILQQLGRQLAQQAADHRALLAQPHPLVRNGAGAAAPGAPDG
ncbi:hypothetical protein QU38_01275, partial [Staphylococcus aureus]